VTGNNGDAMLFLLGPSLRQHTPFLFRLKTCQSLLLVWKFTELKPEIFSPLQPVSHYHLWLIVSLVIPVNRYKCAARVVKVIRNNILGIFVAPFKMDEDCDALAV
jgi:hypothetical protein